LAEKYYGAIPRGPDVRRVRPQEPPHGAARRVTLKDARVRQPSWRRSYLAPSLGNGKRDEVYALEVLSEIFGGGATSRLFRKLVVENKIAVGAGAHYDGDERGPTSFLIYGSPLPGVSMDKLEAAIEAEIARLLKDGVSADEVARAKKRMQADAVYARDSLGAGARVLGAALASGQTIEDVEAWPERIGAVTVEQVHAAARAVFEDRNTVTGLLLAEKSE
jgi:zinc protease